MTREEGTIAELSVSMVCMGAERRWLQQDGVRGLFDGEKVAARSDAAGKVQVSALHEKVGQLIMERDFFRERSGR